MHFDFGCPRSGECSHLQGQQIKVFQEIREPTYAGVEDTKLVRLFPKDFDALQQAILQLYEYRDLETFRQAVPAIFLKLIPAEAFWWPEYHVDLAAQQVTVLSLAGSDSSLLERLSKLAPRQLLNHPSTQYSLKTGNTTALSLSDFLTLPRFRDSVLYQECYRHLDVERELSGSVFSRRG